MNVSRNAGRAVWLCEFDGCDELAVGEIHAQWTVVDFASWAICINHIKEGGDIIENRLVDGQEPQDIYMSWWT